jgi:hypothetical protein
MVGAPAAAFFKRAALGLISVSGLVYGTVAQAGDWTITPRLSVSEEFTDNSGLDFDSQDRNSDFITQVSPSFSIVGTGRRASLDLNYAFDHTFYHRKTRGDGNNNDLNATGQVELWKRVLFIDGAAAISQVAEDGTSATSNSISGQNINRTEARSFTLSPFIRQHFGQWLETETRVAFDKTTTESEVVDDTLTRTGTFVVNGGRRFARFPWSIVALEARTQNNGSEPTERTRRADGNFGYVLNRNLTLTGSVGWEDVDDSGLTEQPNGLTWSGGFTLRPSPRTAFTFSAGRRNDEITFSGNASHRISPRTSVDASYTDSIQTSQRADPTISSPFGLSEDTFRQKLFQLNFNGTRRRNTFSGGVNFEERDTESTGITAKSLGGNLSLGRRISPRLTGNIGVGAIVTDFGTADEREDIDYSASASLSYRVRNDIRATLSYNLTLTKVNNAPEDLLENAVSIGLTKNF